jgi:uncharacterized protein YidB (DUF937 family)
MGLMDILNGMQNGPRGQTAPGKGGMSPITMAILALLAYKAYQKVGTGQGAPIPAPAPQRLPDRRTIEANAPGGDASGGGGLDDLLKGGLGGLLDGLNRGMGGQARPPAGRAAAAPSGLEDLLKGGLGGLLGGAAAGGALSGGLGDLLKQFQNNGMGDVAGSWVGKGPNRDISSNDLARSIGSDDIDTMARRFGVSSDELVEGLREQLPEVVDQLTPDGRLPTAEEASRWV